MIDQKRRYVYTEDDDDGDDDNNDVDTVCVESLLWLRFVDNIVMINLVIECSFAVIR